MGDVKHLEPSELGTKDYWEKSYENDIANGVGADEEADLTQLESWFDDCDAPRKVLEYLTAEDFPLSPENLSPDNAAALQILDLGCGNGSALFELKLEGGYEGRMTGIDYAQRSIDLARRLWQRHCQGGGIEESVANAITFEQFDLILDKPEDKDWWPAGGYDLVLDKGTFDAISLSAETTEDAGKDVRIIEVYPRRVVRMLKPGGFLVITSCNWTEEEVVRWFTKSAEVEGLLTVFGRIRYPVYQFGGRQGQGVASVCFQKVCP